MNCLLVQIDQTYYVHCRVCSQEGKSKSDIVQTAMDRGNRKADLRRAYPTHKWMLIVLLPKANKEALL